MNSKPHQPKPNVIQTNQTANTLTPPAHETTTEAPLQPKQQNTPPYSLLDQSSTHTHTHTPPSCTSTYINRIQVSTALTTNISIIHPTQTMTPPPTTPFSRIEFEKSILFRKKDCPSPFIFFKRDTDTRKRKTEGLPKKLLTVDISPPQFPSLSPTTTSTPTRFSLVLICQQECANHSLQLLKVRDHIYLHPHETTRDVPFNIPLAKGKIRNREFLFVGMDHDTGVVYPIEWKIRECTTTTTNNNDVKEESSNNNSDYHYYSGFFKVLSRNTRGDGVQKQVDQGLSEMNDDLWHRITLLMMQQDHGHDGDQSSSSLVPQHHDKEQKIMTVLSSSPSPLPVSSPVSSIARHSPTMSSNGSSSSSNSPTLALLNGHHHHHQQQHHAHVDSVNVISPSESKLMTMMRKKRSFEQVSAAVNADVDVEHDDDDCRVVVVERILVKLVT